MRSLSDEEAAYVESLYRDYRESLLLIALRRTGKRRSVIEPEFDEAFQATLLVVCVRLQRRTWFVEWTYEATFGKLAAYVRNFLWLENRKRPGAAFLFCDAEKADDAAEQLAVYFDDTDWRDTRAACALSVAFADALGDLRPHMRDLVGAWVDLVESGDVDFEGWRERWVELLHERLEFRTGKSRTLKGVRTGVQRMRNAFWQSLVDRGVVSGRRPDLRHGRT